MTENDPAIPVVDLTPAQVDFCSRHIRGFARQGWRATPAGSAASSRVFLRLLAPHAEASGRILVVWDSADSDWARFVAIHRGASGKVDLLPAIFAVDESLGLILEEDCGDLTLKAFLRENSGQYDAVERTYERVLDALVKWQRMPTADISPIAERCLDHDMFMWETEYFATHCVSEYFGMGYLLDAAWKETRARMAQATSSLPLTCVHRDFQSENVLLQESKVRFVDYQGARMGPSEYDIASLLFDPYVEPLEQGVRARLIAHFAAEAGTQVTEGSVNLAGLQRLCQALGAYANLSLHKSKEGYRKHIPAALAQLVRVAEDHGGFPRLTEIARLCAEQAMSQL